MTKEREKKLRVVYEVHQELKINDKILDLDYQDYLNLAEMIIQVFNEDISEDSIDECIGLIGAGILTGYRL